MTKKEFQEALDSIMKAEAELQVIENQIEELETNYLERTWN